MNETATMAPSPDAAILATLAKLEVVSKFLQSPFFMAQLLEGQRQAAIQCSSPWLDRSAAGAYVYASPAEVDRAATAGIITKYARGGTPMFLKEEIDGAIKSGKWVPWAEKGKKLINREIR